MKFKVGDKVRFVGTKRHQISTGVRKSCDITNKTGVITEFLGEDANYQGIVKNWYTCTIDPSARFSALACIHVPCSQTSACPD